MSFSKIVVVALLLTPAVAIAAEPSQQASLVVPGVMTTAGGKFAKQCNDEAFSSSTNQRVLGEKCQKLLARWRAEAQLRRERRDNPRLIAVAKAVDTDANLPFDTVASLRGDPFAGVGAR
ncbi:MAG: hypothetical protein ABIP44_02575 [Pseudoxanthomonas sp.]